MAGFSLMNKHNTNEKVAEAKKLKNCILVDIREREDYLKGHIPSAINVPLSEIKTIEEKVENKKSLLYIYCQSGARARNAVKTFNKMGYMRVQNIGGMRNYSGEPEVGE